jgi:Ca2+-transporting ATPase
LIVWIINFSNSHNVLDSFTQALTLAECEEIPIAFTTFMALAWRMMKNGIIVKQNEDCRNIRSATVICIDKTGTITDKMSLAKIFTLKSQKLQDRDNEYG